jgi:hypothetical protein
LLGWSSRQSSRDLDAVLLPSVDVASLLAAPPLASSTAAPASPGGAPTGSPPLPPPRGAGDATAASPNRNPALRPRLPTGAGGEGEGAPPPPFGGFAAVAGTPLEGDSPAVKSWPLAVQQDSCSPRAFSPDRANRSSAAAGPLGEAASSGEEAPSANGGAASPAPAAAASPAPAPDGKAAAARAASPSPARGPNAAAAEAAATTAAARKRKVTAMTCLEAFFVKELVSWECPKEKAEARERRWSTASGGAGGTPRAASLGRQVTFSAGLPSIVSVPGSVEQRGTDLARALSGAAPLCRPVGAGGAALLLTAQLARGGEGPVAAPSPLARSPSVSPSAASTLLQMAGRGAAAAAAVPGAAAEPLVAGRLRLKLVAAGEPNKKTDELLGPWGAVDLGEVSLPQAAAARAGRGRARLLRAWAQLALDCMADLLRHEGGVKGLSAMLEGGAALVPPPEGAPGVAARQRAREDAAGGGGEEEDATGAGSGSGDEEAGGGEGPVDEYLGWSLRGQLPRAAPAPSSGKGAAAAGGGGGGYWEYPYREDAEQQPAAPGAVPAAGAAAHERAAASNDKARAAGPAAGGDDGEMFGMDDLAPEKQQAPGAAKRPAAAAAPRPQQQQPVAGSDEPHMPHFRAGVRKVPAPEGGGDAAAFAANGLTTSATSGGAPPERTGSTGAGSASSGSAPVDITPRRLGGLTSAVAAAGSPFGRSPALGATPRRSSLSARTFTRDASKSYQVYLPPRVLVLHLKRFAHDLARGGKLQKLDAPVAFEFELDLGPFVSRSSPQYGQAMVYDLAGVVVHMGNMRSGHYVAYVKRGPAIAAAAAAAAAASGGGAASAPGSSGGAGSMNGGLSGAAGAAGAAAAGLLSAIGGALSGGKIGSGAGGEQWYYISDGTVRPVARSEVAGSQAYLLMYTRRDAEPAAAEAAAAAAAADSSSGSGSSAAAAAAAAAAPASPAASCAAAAPPPQGTAA